MESFFVFLAGPLGPAEFPEGQIYALDERRGLFQRPAKDPIQLTSGPIEWSPPVFSKDGKKIFATRFDKEGRTGSSRPEIQSVSALSWRHLRRIGRLLQRRPVRGVCLLPRRHPVESKPGWKRPRSTDQSAFASAIPAWSPDGSQIVFEAPSPAGSACLDRSIHGWQSTAASSRGQRTGGRSELVARRAQDYLCHGRDLGAARATYVSSTSPVIR